MEDLKKKKVNLTERKKKAEREYNYAHTVQGQDCVQYVCMILRFGHRYYKTGLQYMIMVRAQTYCRPGASILVKVIGYV